MRITEAARYARWAALAAVVVASIVAAVYSYRAWQAEQARKQAPSAVPPPVQQRSTQFSFSRVEQDRTLFTVRASRATEFKEGNKNLLEDVWITIYGRSGQRYDNIHTQACEYLSDTGNIVCAGEVAIDLESAEEARERPGQRVIHLGTRNVSFSRDTGEAHTDQPVEFRLPYGEGRAVGLRYSSRNAEVRLLRDVRWNLHSARGGLPVELSGDSMEYRRATHTLRLLTPVRAQQGSRELVAGELSLEFDAALRARRLVARKGPAGAEGQPEVRSIERQGHALLVADEFTVQFDSESRAERVVAGPDARGSLTGPNGTSQLTAGRLELELDPQGGQPRLLTAINGVHARSTSRGETRDLQTAAMRLFFAPAERSLQRRLDRGETLAPATVELTSPSSSVGEAAPATRISGRQMFAEFDPRNHLRQLSGRDNVEVERRLPGRPAQVSTSREFLARFGTAGAWTEVEQAGNVRFREGDRAAQADRARMDRASDSIRLAGSAAVSDLAMRTTAQTIVSNQKTGELRAEGEVRTTYRSTAGNEVPNLAPEPGFVAAPRLLANASAGRALYSGGARLWQGPSVIEAESIEFLRDAKQLAARGNVRAVFPQAASAAPDATKARAVSGSEPDVWRFRAGRLTYWNDQGRALLEQNVIGESRQAQISSRVLEALFTRMSAPGTVAAGADGAKRLERVVATGGVVVRQGDRRGTAERAEYYAAEEKMILSGGTPTLIDASRGTTTGRRLTFFFANDTIIIDSGEGSRTLTKHRVEK